MIAAILGGTGTVSNTKTRIIALLLKKPLKQHNEGAEQMHRQDASNSAAFPVLLSKKTTIDNDIIIKGYLNSASLATGIYPGKRLSNCSPS